MDSGSLITIEFVVFLVVGLIVVLVILYALFVRAARRRDNKKKPKIQALAKAEELFAQQNYELCIIQALSSVELALQDHYNSDGTVFELLQLAQDKGVFAEDRLHALHELRKLRNQIAHGESVTVSKKQAEGYLYAAQGANEVLGYEV